MGWFIVILAAWAVCGLFGYGLTFAHFQRKFPTLAARDRASDASFARFFALTGPIGLLTALIFYEGHGLLWRTPNPQQEGR